MGFIEASIFILFIAIIAARISVRFNLPQEIFLLLGSCMLGMITQLTEFYIDPKIVFQIFLPPILFSAAYFTSWRDFKFNLRPICLLALGLVCFSMVVVAIATKYIIPDLSWAEAFLFGAIVSPTDASSATAIIKKLGAPRRIITILEGESLINDASALLLFKFSLIAVFTGSFSVIKALPQFFLLTAGGAGLGLVLGVVSIYLIKKLHSTSAEVTVTLLTAFASYAIAEHLGVSGVISTVACGIYVGIYFPSIASSKTRMESKASWNTLLFIINGFVFTMIGLELPSIISNLSNYSPITLLWYGFFISMIVIISRVIWLFAMAHISRLIVPSISKTDPRPPWPVLFTLGWCGMRGIVSLAAALSIPYNLSSGVFFPHRSILLFITYSVIIVTLIVPTVTLPYFLKRFGLLNTEDKVKEEAIARMRSLEESLKKIQELNDNKAAPSEIINDFCKQIHRKIKIVETQLNKSPYSSLTDDYMAIKKIANAVIKSERATLLKLRKEGEVNEDIFHLLSDELDLEELRANSLRV